MTRLFSIIELESKPQHRESLLEHARTLIDHGKANAEIISHEIHIGSHNPCRMIVTIRWRDEEALKAHYDSPSLRAYLQKTTSYLAHPSIHRTFRIDSEQTLL